MMVLVKGILVAIAAGLLAANSAAHDDDALAASLAAVAHASAAPAATRRDAPDDATNCDDETVGPWRDGGCWLAAGAGSVSLLQTGVERTHGALGESPRCKDNSNYRDPKGFTCDQWRRYPCSQAARTYGYRPWEQQQLIEECPVACNACMATAASITGVSRNTVGDADAFVASLHTNGGIMVGCVVLVSVLRLLFPTVYSNNALEEKAPAVPETLFGWVMAVLSVTTEQVEEAAGLDAAMLLEFCELAMKLFAVLSCCALVLMPLHYYEGNMIDIDKLGTVGLAHVVHFHPWLYWVHVAVLWSMVILTHLFIRQAQERFLVRRFAWLQRRPVPEVKTVLVEGIEGPYRSDGGLAEFFTRHFAEVEAAHVVKFTRALPGMLARRDAAALGLHEQTLAWDRNGRIPEMRPRIRESLWSGQYHDAIDYYTKKVEDLDGMIAAERTRIEAASATAGGVNSEFGFVTFKRTRDATFAAAGLRFGRRKSDWVVSLAPPPSHVVWEKLQRPRALRTVFEVVGYSLTAFLYLLFIPVCVAVSNLASSVAVPDIIAPYWTAFAPTMGLQVFVCFLPTVLVLIFNTFFCLKSDGEEQHSLQKWFFWFQVLFVLLVAAIGQSVWSFVELLINNPAAIFDVLATQMPDTSNFYLNYLVLQWATHGLNILRYQNLVKFQLYRGWYGSKVGREMAEPEDQAYFGIGARSAFFTIAALIGITFFSISPLMAPVAFVNFAVCRVVYGYLLVFAETRKTDLGGIFWVTMLEHLQYGLLVFVVLMIGVLSGRSYSPWPVVVAAPSLPFAILAVKMFQDDFLWESLPLSESDTTKQVGTGEVYVQPELLRAVNEPSRFQRTHSMVMKSSEEL